MDCPVHLCISIVRSTLLLVIADRLTAKRTLFRCIVSLIALWKVTYPGRMNDYSWTWTDDLLKPEDLRAVG